MWLETDDEQQNQNKQNNTNNNIGSGGGVGISTPSTGSNTPQGNPSTISSTKSDAPTQQFATVNDYLGANKQQGEDLGQKVTSSLDTQQNQDKSSIDQAAQSTNNDINSNTINYDAGLVNKAVADPTSVANNSTDLNSFLKQWNASYSGPQSFETSNQYGQATQAASDANTTAQELADTGGREQLIGDQFGVYGQGNKGLDQAVLQNSSYFPKVQQQQQGFNSIQDYLGNTASNVDNVATTAQATTDATKAATQGQFANSLTNFQGDLNNRVSSAQDAANQATQQYQKDFASGDTNKVQQDLATSGVDAATAKNITDYLSSLKGDYGINPTIQSSLIANPQTDINAGNVASTNDYAKAAALQKLTGVDYSGVLNPNNAAQAGTGTFAQQSLKSPDLSTYLKNSLNIQDNSLLGTAPTLNWDDVNSGKLSSQDTAKAVQQTIDAGTRQGLDPNKNPALQSLESNAFGGLQAIYLGGQNAQSRPVAKTYADTAVQSLVAKGQTQEQAQQFVNNWVKNLSQQVRKPYVPVYN